jgi:hypothetical protein
MDMDDVLGSRDPGKEGTKAHHATDHSRLSDPGPIRHFLLFQGLSQPQVKTLLQSREDDQT